jgi:hypothetical protein
MAPSRDGDGVSITTLTVGGAESTTNDFVFGDVSTKPYVSEAWIVRVCGPSARSSCQTGSQSEGQQSRKKH